MQVWNVLHAARWNIGRKTDAKNRHLGTIALLCRAMSSQWRHVSTIGKKLVKQQYVLHMSPQYGEPWPPSGWDRSGSLRHPCKFQRVSRLGSVTARHLVVSVSQLCGVEQRTPPMFGRATITLGIGRHSSIHRQTLPRQAVVGVMKWKKLWAAAMKRAGINFWKITKLTDWYRVVSDFHTSLYSAYEEKSRVVIKAVLNCTQHPMH